MSRTAIAPFKITCLLCSAFLVGLAANIQPVKADYAWTETIYIRADGSVEPSAAPISTADNATYALTDDIVGTVPYNSSAIVVERDDILVDGAGYMLQGTEASASTGIRVTGRRNVTIKNMKITAFYHGILLSSCNNNTLSGNSITANSNCGVLLDYSSGNVICHNSFINNNQVSSFQSTNVWDDSYPSGGNYWSDYTGVDLYNGFYQNETGHDWVEDTPYVIDAHNADRYPLMHPFDPQTEEVRIAYLNLLTEYNHLRADFESLNSTYYDQTTQNELANIKNILYIFIAITVILAAALIYAATRKPKTKTRKVTNL